ncbi:MAG: multiheme c-type cytochrome [Gemmatimonadaceae bacterium]|nr:multiheme c-type cytochrome [Gemmatimonadaceae bacterium]
MKRTLSLLALAASVVSTANMAGAQAGGHTYVGAKACGLCHKAEKKGNQLGVWQKSKHAKAYTTLTTEAANDIAKAKGITTPAAEAPACLKCHAIVGDAKADIKDGVQCETCHGPGSDYKSLTVMKAKGKAVAAGMKEYKDKAAIEKQCRTCHNEKSPTAKEFKFEERWAKIKHPVLTSP